MAKLRGLRQRKPATQPDGVNGVHGVIGSMMQHVTGGTPPLQGQPPPRPQPHQQPQQSTQPQPQPRARAPWLTLDSAAPLAPTARLLFYLVQMLNMYLEIDLGYVMQRPVLVPPWPFSVPQLPRGFGEWCMAPRAETWLGGGKQYVVEVSIRLAC